MSMHVRSTVSAYGDYQKGYHSSRVKEKKETKDLQNVEKAVKKSLVSNGEKKLSASAQKMLQMLRNSRQDMDFMVADFDNGDNAKEMLSRSNKEFTVIFSNEELEKMAADEKYYEEKMRGIDGAIRMSEEINAKFGFERAFGKMEGLDDGVAITKFGISFNSDGSTTLFAELKKTSSQQKERLEEMHEQRAKEKREIKKNEKHNSDSKKITLQASTWEELREKIKNINWDAIKNDTKTVGSAIDFTV